MEKTCDNCDHKDKTGQEKPCCYCGCGNPAWEGAVYETKKRSR